MAPLSALEQLAHVGIFDVSKPVPAVAAPVVVTSSRLDCILAICPCGATRTHRERCHDPEGHLAWQAADSPDYIDAAYRDDAP